MNNAYLLATVVPGVLVGLNDFLLYVPASRYVSHRIVAMGIYSTRLSPKLSLNAVVQLGPYLQDEYYQYAFYAAGQVGISLTL